MGGAGDGALLLGNGLARPPRLLHGPLLDERLPVCGDRAVPQHEVVVPILITGPYRNKERDQVGGRWRQHTDARDPGVPQPPWVSGPC